MIGFYEGLFQTRTWIFRIKLGMVFVQFYWRLSTNLKVKCNLLNDINFRNYSIQFMCL